MTYIKLKDGSNATYQLIFQDEQLYIRLNKLDDNGVQIETIPIIMSEDNKYMAFIRTTIQEILKERDI